MSSPYSQRAEKPGRFDALRSKDFRLFWFGHLISVAGQQMLWITQGWLIYELTGSALLLGLNGLAQAVPATALALFGGVVADKVNMRRLVIAGEIAHAIFLLALATLAFTQTIQAWHVIANAFALSAVNAFANPGRQAMFPHLAPRQFLPSAVALNSTIHPGTRVIGPMIAGFLLAGVMEASESAALAAGAAFALTATGHGIYVIFLRAIHMPVVQRAAGKRFIGEMAEGLRLIWREPVYALLLGTAYFNMFWVVSLSVLLPIFAKDFLLVDASGLGLLYTAMGIGSLTGALLATNAASAFGRSWAIVSGSAFLAVFVILFAWSTWFPLSLAMLALTGIGISVSNVNIQTSLQLLVRNEYRGRLMGYWGMTHSAVRPTGEMQLASIAAFASAPVALTLGGGMVAAFALLILAPNSRFRGLDNLEAAESMAQREKSAEHEKALTNAPAGGQESE